MLSYCLLVPHFNHDAQFLAFLPSLRTTGLPLVVVDDGSGHDSIQAVRQAIEEYPEAHLFELQSNRGKGAAVMAGFCYARGLGYTHVIQIDADGQHCLADLPAFMAASSKSPHAIICGKPFFDATAPKARVYGRKVTDFWAALETLSLKIKDGLCGYRIYPLSEVEKVIDNYYVGCRMDFDTEILVKAVWQKVALEFLKTKVIYPERSVSHFHYWRDNLLLIRLHTRLMLGMLIRSPKLIVHRLRGF